jgi:hypothetical protein
MACNDVSLTELEQIRHFHTADVLGKRAPGLVATTGRWFSSK